MNFDSDSYNSATVAMETEYGITFTTVRDLFLDPEEAFKEANSTPAEISDVRNFVETEKIHFVSNHFEAEYVEMGKPTTSSANVLFSLGRFSKTSDHLSTTTDDVDVVERRLSLQQKNELPGIVTEFITTKHLRTKVFSGNKTKGLDSNENCVQESPIPVQIPKLVQLSSKVVQTHAERLVGFEKLSTTLLLNVLSKAKVKQLILIERLNPGILEKTNQVWKMKFSREFKGMSAPDGRSWKEIYLNAVDKRTASIKKSVKNIPSTKSNSTCTSSSVKEKALAKPTTTKRKLTLDDTGFLIAFGIADTEPERSKVKGRKRKPTSK